MNPASLAHAPTFVGGVFYREGWLDGINHDSLVAVNIVDNSDGVFVPGSLGYIQRSTHYSGQHSVSRKAWNLSVGSFFMPMLAGGLSLHHVNMESNGESYTDFNATMGVIWNPHPDWGFGLALYQVFGGNRKIPSYFREPQKLTLGATHVVSEYLRLRLDVASVLEDNPENKLQIMGGFESFLTSYFVMRVGWKADEFASRDTFTAGFSFLGPRFTLDYAYQNTFADSSQGALHSVDLSFPF